MIKINKQTGFTLIDILVSISIISFLSSIVLFNVSEGRVRAQDAKMKTESGQIATAIEIFKTSNGGKTPIHIHAQDFQSLNIFPGEMYQEGTDEYNAIMNELVSGGYISEIPTSPDGTSYAYGESIDGTQAVFAARLQSERSISTNTRNSCDVIDQESTPPTNCQNVTGAQCPPNLTWSLRCSQYLTDNPNKICVFGSTSNFCSAYNQNGEMSTFCACSGIFCGQYGGTNFSVIGGPCQATICDAPQTNSSLCDGSNPEDYCTCI